MGEPDKVRRLPDPGHFEILTREQTRLAASCEASPMHPELDPRGFDIAAREIESWPGYRATPLVELPGLGSALGVATLRYKDEGSRFGLGSFKALGGGYAVFRLLSDLIERANGRCLAGARDLFSGRYADDLRHITVTTATDGNHGRAVAWGAQRFGCTSVIFIHQNVSEARAEAIARLGAKVVRVPGNYDDAVRHAAREAARNGWHVVSDTSYGGYFDVPREVMYGYSVMVKEAFEQWPAGERPTHAFLQAGVGAMAASVAAYLRAKHADTSPRIIVVEPEQAACVFESARHAAPTIVEGTLDTIMAGLACGEVSPIAWQVLAREAHAFMVVSDAAAKRAMRLLADAPYGDAPIVAGESAVAGVCGLIAACSCKDAGARLDLDRNSRVLVFGTEGATDPSRFAQIVGRSSEEVTRHGG